MIALCARLPEPRIVRGMPTSTLTHLECGRCERRHDPTILQNLCTECGKPLLARYDLTVARQSLTRDSLLGRPFDLWRYAEVLPPVEPLRLGEGGTALLSAPRLGESLGLRSVYVKDEASNAGGSFKARGLAVAVAMARQLGARKLAIPTAGNAGLAMAAYAARVGLSGIVFCPRDTPTPFVEAARLLGAEVVLVDGLIHDCGRIVRERAPVEGWFDLSTLKEPYRLEGKKTMGYELFEQLGRLPDVVLYPTGGGTGLVGMWKAFDEMEQLGWISDQRPRMISVQAEGCAPIVRAFEAGSEEAELFPNAATVASGLRVPGAIADFLILRAIRASHGLAIAVSDEEMVRGSHELGASEGILAAPEGGATLAALRRLVETRQVAPEETIVLFNTGSALSYLDALRPMTAKESLHV